MPHLPTGTPVVYDSHELFLEAGTASRLPGLLRGLLRKYERRLIARTVAVITVNDEIAEVLRRRYAPRRIAVVHNCPDRWAGPFDGRPLLREAAGIPAGDAIVLYHGALTSGRGIELLTETMLQPGLEDAHLVLMGMGDRRDTYLRPRRRPALGRAGPRPAARSSPAELMPWVASADVGAIPNPGGTLNDRFSAPNKLFECLARRHPGRGRGLPDPPPDRDGRPARARSGPSATRRAPRTSPRRCDPSSAWTRPPEPPCGHAAPQAATERWNWQAEAVALTDLYADRPRGLADAPGPSGRSTGSPVDAMVSGTASAPTTGDRLGGSRTG